MSSQTYPEDMSPPPQYRGSKAAVDVVLLSADEQIFETTRNAVAEQHPVWRAQSTDEAIEHLVSGRCGVLVIDLGTVSSEPASFVLQVTRQFPDLVVVATGRQTDAPLLGTMISDGLIYRFMHKPLSPNRAGMFLSHAIASHAERRRHPGIVQALLPSVAELPPRVERRFRYGAVVAVLVLLGALVAYLMQRDDPPDAAGTSSELERPQGAGIPPEVLLPRAAAALEAGRLEAPAGDNALDLYRDVLLAQPRHPEASAGLDRTTGLLLEKAHAESVAGRGDEARRLVRRVLAVDPANPLALAMQARLEVPPPNAAEPAERPVESLATLLRREFRSAPRRTPAPAPTPRAAVPDGPVNEAPLPPAAVVAATGGAALLTSSGPAGTAAAATTGSTAGAPAAVPTPAPPIADPAGSGPSLVPLREFTRVSTTEPEYPVDARQTGTEGWVRLEFTVNERGRVRDIVVVAADPRGVFEDAASAALSRWRFRPPVAGDGQPVARRTTVQLRFELED